MRNVNIIVSIMVALSAATVPAAYPPKKPAKTPRVFVGLNLGGSRNAAEGNRIAAAGWGAAGSGEVGYRLAPWLIAPYVTAGAAWGRGEAPEWERNGYYYRAWYMGLLTTRVTAGALCRHAVLGRRVYAYGGPAFLAAWQRHEVQDGLGVTMETRRGSGFGWAAFAGLEFRPGGAEAVGLQGMYGQAYSSWSGLPAAADEGFTYAEFQISGFLRFFI